jgi:WhiB family redox-sensing transcriptional regulator
MVDRMNPAEVQWLMLADPAAEVPTLEGLLGRPLWMARGACRGAGTATFIARSGRPKTAAMAMCGACVVRSECLAYAMAEPDLVGVWGGTTAKQRASMRRAAA